MKTRVTYEFPFRLPSKERARAKGHVIGGKVRTTMYTPKKTKDFYKKIRLYVMEHYPNYQEQMVVDDCEIELIIGVKKHKLFNDLDNSIKMLDCFNRDKAQKGNTGFKGIWSDDKLIKKMTCEFVYVENKEDEFTKLSIITPYEPVTINHE